MARPKKENPPSKDRFIHVRVTEDLYEVISKEAAEAHLSVSAYFRKIATDKRITLKKEIVFNDSELLAALSNLGKIGSNLNQIAKYLNESDTASNQLRQELHYSLLRLHMDHIPFPLTTPHDNLCQAYFIKFYSITATLKNHTVHNIINTSKTYLCLLLCVLTTDSSIHFQVFLCGRNINI